MSNAQSFGTRWALLALLLAACGGGTKDAKGPDSAERLQLSPQPTPPALSNDVTTATRLGLLIQKQDVLAARATDLLLVAGSPPQDAAGWVAYEEQNVGKVAFIAGQENGYYAFTRVNIGATEETVQRERSELTAQELEMFRARRSALSQPFLKCSPRYNVVVLPASEIGQRGWLVYLLPADITSRERHLGGYHRFLVSSDGRVLSHQPFSNTCIDIPALTPPDGKAAAFFVNHVLSEAPVESHVFANLHYRTPILVGTSRGVWGIERGAVQFLGKQPPRDAERGPRMPERMCEARDNP